jgi:hypothetical protein
MDTFSSAQWIYLLWFTGFVFFSTRCTSGEFILYGFIYMNIIGSPRQLVPTVGISDDWISLSGRDRRVHPQHPQRN